MKISSNQPEAGPQSSNDTLLSASRKRWFALILMLGTMGLLAVVMEVALRVRHGSAALKPPHYYGKLPRFEAHPFLPFTGRPNDSRVLPWKHEFFGDFTLKYRTNRYGFLGDEFRSEKQPGETRIVTFGGSTTWMMGVDRQSGVGEEKDTWPNVLQRALATRFPERSITVYNLAQDAYCSPMSVVNLALVGVSLHPDFVISYDGINDMLDTFDFDMRTDYADRFSHYQGYRSVGLNWPRWLFRSQLICWLALKLDRLAGNEQEQNPFLRVTPPQRADAFRGNFWNSASLKNMELLERNLKTMRGICREYGATFVAATMHYFERDKLRDQVNARLREFYRRESIPFFDADQKIPKGDKSINTDEVHFTRDGTELMAAGFAEIVAVALPQKPERTHNENRN